MAVMMRLYYTTASPFARKVRVVAEELGLAGLIDPIVAQTTPLEPDAGLTRANPVSKVPALQTEAGLWLYDSRVICEYLNERAGGNLLPTGTNRWPVLRLQALADAVLDAGVLVIYETRRPASYQWPEWMRGQVGKVLRALDAIESSPSDLEGELNIGQVTLACAVDWLLFRNVAGDVREGRPTLARWHQVFGQRPSMRSTVPR
jgi:glutathione S-transferase